MKLSICIPVYNFDVNLLIKTLKKEISEKRLAVEIIIIDDASDPEFVAVNKILETEVDHYIGLKENIGRSKIRNLFLDFAHSDYLLFLDCDGKINQSNFLTQYLQVIDSKKPNVVYGGRIVHGDKPLKNYNLRWEFATKRENLPIDIRKTHPYSSFQTNNFMIKRTVLLEHHFNEDITQYGYEDLVFAMLLRKEKIKVLHIDNPVINNDIETNDLFLCKSKQSAKSLSQLLKKNKDIDQFAEIKLAKAYLYLEKIHCIFLTEILYKISKRTIKKRLLSGKSSLRELDFYKLGELIHYMKK